MTFSDWSLGDLNTTHSSRFITLIAAEVFDWSSTATSILIFLVIISLSAAVSDSSDKLSNEFEDLLGALINATFGNAVELILIVILR